MCKKIIELVSSRCVAVPVLLLLATATSFAQSSVTLQVLQSGRGSLASAPTGADVIGKPEVDPAVVGDDDADLPLSGGKMVNRSIAIHTGSGPMLQGSGKAKSNPELNFSFDALNHRAQRLANGGNQFSVEPPDQGLCAGNGFVMETINDVMQIFDANGNPLTGVVDLNTFYGYPAAINRSTGQFGPDISDPSCYFDIDTQRWFHIVITLDRVGTTSALSGKNHIDIAVTATPSPLGPWNIYHLPVQNDGTDGTPNLILAPTRTAYSLRQTSLPCSGPDSSGHRFTGYPSRRWQPAPRVCRVCILIQVTRAFLSLDLQCGRRSLPMASMLEHMEERSSS